MTPFHRVDVLHDGQVVRIERNERPYETALELNQERVQLGIILDQLGRAGKGLLIDSRAAPHSTDERLQEEFRRFRLEIERGFERVAALVRTKVAILQVNRLVRDSSSSVKAFDDEAAAIVYALGRARSLRPR